MQRAVLYWDEELKGSNVGILSSDNPNQPEPTGNCAYFVSDAVLSLISDS